MSFKLDPSVYLSECEMAQNTNLFHLLEAKVQKFVQICKIMAMNIGRKVPAMCPTELGASVVVVVVVSVVVASEGVVVVVVEVVEVVVVVVVIVVVVVVVVVEVV